MSHEDLIQRVADSARVTEEHVEALDIEQAESELMSSIMSDSSTGRRMRMRLGSMAQSRRPRFALRAGGALAGAAIAAALIFSGNEPGNDKGAGVAYAAEWIRIAEENPRLLVTAPDWEVTRADEYKRDYGEMTFANGSAELYLHWYPIDTYSGFFADRAHDTDQTNIDVLGRNATLFADAYNNYSALLRPGGNTFVEITSDADRTMERAQFLGLLDTIEAVDVDAWLAALPASTVRPDDRLATVQETLEGIPVPPGLDLESLEKGNTARDRYQLGAVVTAAVTCAWLERRMSGLQAGDSAKVKEAEEALATARTWPILLEMSDQGGWSHAIWDWAADGRGSSGYGRNSTERPVGALGCSPGNWRGVPSIDPRFK